MKRIRCPKCENYLTFDETSIPKANHWSLYVTSVRSSSVSV